MFNVPAITFYFMTVDEQVATYGVPRSEVVRAVELTGGAAATLINDEVRAASARINPEADLSSVPDGYMIGLSADVFTDEIFSREEIEAIKAHEEGHIVHGHIDALLAETDLEAVCKDDKIRLVMERELEADAYAAEKVGAAHMLSALRKFPGALASFMVREGSAFTHEELTAIYRDRMTTTHAPRLDALERMAAEAK